MNKKIEKEVKEALIIAVKTSEYNHGEIARKLNTNAGTLNRWLSGRTTTCRDINYDAIIGFIEKSHVALYEDMIAKRKIVDDSKENVNLSPFAKLIMNEVRDMKEEQKAQVLELLLKLAKEEKENSPPASSKNKKKLA